MIIGLLCVCVMYVSILSIVMIYKTMMATSCIIKPLCNVFNFFGYNVVNITKIPW